MHHAPELPTLQPGIQLLHTEPQLVEALHALVLDHLLMHDGTAYWVDSHGNATTTSLIKLAPTRRTLDRIHVARGFTGYQHYAAIHHLPTQLADDATLIVAPALDYLYRGDDLTRPQATDMLTGLADQLHTITTQRDIPIIVSLETHDDLTTPIESIAADTITCEHTQYGPRFTTDDFETLVYPTPHGTLQTTITYWRELLTSRVHTRDHHPVEVKYGAD